MKDARWIGEYYLGRELVSLYSDWKSGGGYFSLHERKERRSHPKDCGHGRIVIGFNDSDRWREVMEILEHEVYEYVFTRLGVRFAPDDADNTDHTRYRFLMDHHQFTTAIQWASWFICPALPDLASNFKKYQKATRKK